MCRAKLARLHFRILESMTPPAEVDQLADSDEDTQPKQRRPRAWSKEIDRATLDLERHNERMDDMLRRGEILEKSLKELTDQGDSRLLLS
jgi:hypothetical protein